MGNRVMRPPREWQRAATPLLIALGFAVVFIALRLAYRVVFGGWPDSGAAWAGATLGVLRSSAAFVVVILACGALNTLVDVRAALARWGGRGPLRNLRTALVIALASYPELLASVRRVNESRRMRGDRSLASLVVPVLERSLERGVALGAAMESRGFGSRDLPHGMCDAPVVARDVQIGFGDAAHPSWSVLIGDLTIAHGSCVLLTGPTGSGKTALLRALTGRLQHSGTGWQTGVLEVGGFDRRGAQPHDTAAFVSLVEQNVRDGFVANTVFDEIAFGVRMVGRREVEVNAAVALVADQVGIGELLTRDTSTLSAGEASLVALAAGLVTQPSLLLLDEPIADLDDTARARVIALLTQLHSTTGITIVIAEHRWEALVHLADVRRDLAAESAQESKHESGRDAPSPVVRAPSRASDRGVTRAASPISPLVAPNGAGKTTWLRAFARANAEHVRLVPEDPALLFSRETVAAECRHNDRLAHLTPGATRDFAERLLPHLPMEAHPRDLSTGQRLALACALQGSACPDLLLLDEPTRGLDESSRVQLALMLTELSSTGTAVIFATHDHEFAEQFAQTAVTS